MKKILFIFLTVFVFHSCEEIQNLISNSDNVAGLKEALTVGAKNATGILGQQDGYLKDAAVKILLPEEAQSALSIMKSIQSIPGVGTLLEGVMPSLSSDFDNILITAINRAAEDAAPQAVNIFVDAITRMSITDASNILFGGNNVAATNYLVDNTYTGLQSAFSPVINESLSNVSVSGYTALTAWTTFAEQNNKLANFLDESPFIKETIVTFLPQAANIKTVETNLGSYVTGKALDGLFLKVGDEETKIRTDVNARTSSLLQKVFGQLD